MHCWCHGEEVKAGPSADKAWTAHQENYTFQIINKKSHQEEKQKTESRDSETKRKKLPEVHKKKWPGWCRQCRARNNDCTQVMGDEDDLERRTEERRWRQESQRTARNHVAAKRLGDTETGSKVQKIQGEVRLSGITKPEHNGWHKWNIQKSYNV